MKKYFLLTVTLLTCLGVKAQTTLSGNYTIAGELQVGDKLEVTNLATNTVKSVLARLPEYAHLQVKSYNTQPIFSKSFSIEHSFYGIINNAINFYRGGGAQDGWITFDVCDGRPMAKLSYSGLEINGTIKAKEVLITNTNWADFVFATDYKLPDLNEVKRHITEKKHLPGIPSEAEVKENGVNLGEMQTKLLQKIEELTLYTIRQQEMIDKLNEKIEQLENK